MDLPQKDPIASVTDPVTASAVTGIEHIMQEMYKKNQELNDRNKTLALLRQIDEIVLSAVTDLGQIAQQVSDLLVEEEFRFVSICIVKQEEKVIIPIAISSFSDSKAVSDIGKNKFLKLSITLTEKENVLVKTIQTKKVQIVKTLQDIFGSNISEEESKEAQDEMGVKSIIVYPLIVRLDVIGTLVIGITEEEDSITLEKKALIDRMAGVVGIALDNSLLYRSIQDANERLKQVDKLKDEFVSLASHELRTPMTIIKSYLWLFIDKKKGQLSEKELTYLQRAYVSTERLINLVNDMLNVSRIESGRLSLELKPVQIVDVLEKQVEELMPRAQQLGLKLAFVKPPYPVPLVNADHERIEQVIINLVGNSLKFTPSGGSISVLLKPQKKELLVTVVDTGRGMNKEDMEKLFRKFGTMGESYLHKQEAQGTGLGLYLSKLLVEMHGGKMWAESKGEGKGATFNFTIPFLTH